MTPNEKAEELTDLEPIEEASDLEETPDFEPAGEEVPDLEDVPDLEEVSDPPASGMAQLAELEELEELPAEAAGSEDATAKSGPRELEKAPLMLQKAAVILTVAALFPWLVPGGWVLPTVLAKLLVCLGGYVLYTEVLHLYHADAKIPAPFRAIGNMHDKALGILGLALMLVGVAPVIDPANAILEKAAVAVGLITWCQVFSYSQGGKFNPLWSLIIPMFGIVGLVRLVSMFANFEVFALLGSLGIAAAGVVSGYTMFLALKEAKEHGKKKKQAQMEARKKARKANQKPGRKG